MTRGVDEATVAADLPTVVVVLAALVTQLGDVWFVFLLLGVCYWFGDSLPGPLSLDRTAAAFAVALALGASAVTTTLKQWFAHSRPPGAGDAVALGLLPTLLEEAYVAAATASGYGFPSGHAVGVVVVYGGLALLADSSRGCAAALGVVPVVALSRVVLGVHYVVDVLVGAVVGAVYLLGVYRLCGRGSNPGRALMIALAVALVGAAVEFNFETMAALGGVLGARIAWGSVGDAVVHAPTTRTGGAVATAIGVALGGAFAAMYAVGVAPHVAFLGTAAILGGGVAAPLLGESAARRLTDRPATTAPTGD
jgi:membrane-associated phospholipid phosphatase